MTKVDYKKIDVLGLDNVEQQCVWHAVSWKTIQYYYQLQELWGYKSVTTRSQEGSIKYF